MHLLSSGVLVTIWNQSPQWQHCWSFGAFTCPEAGLCLQAASHRQHAVGLCQDGLLAPPKPAGSSWGADGGGPDQVSASGNQTVWNVFCMLQQAMCAAGCCMRCSKLLHYASTCLCSAIHWAHHSWSC